MGEDNVKEFAAALEGEAALAAFLEPQIPGLLGASPEELVTAMRSLLSPVDAAALTDDLGVFLADQFGHALAAGPGGWIDDDLAFCRDWGFALDDLAVPVVLWQGAHDLMVPPAHGRWLGERVAGAELNFSETDGHVSLLETQVPAILARLSRYTF
jgi:pimeloyl-ACP methyl ester carboxylesterase